MINFMLLISRHGKTRLNKYYKHFTQKERQNIQKEVSNTFLIIIVSQIDQYYGYREVKQVDTLPGMA